MTDTTPLTDGQLAEIGAREAAATPEPWTWTEDGIQAANDEWVMWPANTGPGAAETAAGQLGACGRHTETHAEDNLTFLAHARQDVPALLAEVRRLRAVEAAARGFADEMGDYCSPHGVAADYAQRLRERLDQAGAAS
jgi:hypothetical protein